MSDDELRRDLQDSMRRTPAATDGDLAAVARRARSLRRRRVARGVATAGVLCAAVATPLVMLAPLGGGGSRPPAAVGTGPQSPSPSASPDTGVIHVNRVVKGDGHLLYIEGAIAYVRLVEDGGPAVVEKRLPSYVEDWSGDLVVTPGHYELQSYVRICQANCGNPGPPADQCSAHLWVLAGDEIEATITYRPGKGCSTEYASVVSPAGLTPTPATPDCGDAGAVSGISDYGAGAKGLVGDPVDLARDHFQRLLDTDVVQLVSQGDEQATVAVVRDGTTVATAVYDSDGQGGWLLSEVTRCQDSGLIG
jgi:hypothetical protein